MTSANRKHPVGDRHRERSAKLWPLLEAPLRETARQHGYALGVHGTLVRDFDLIAVPWSSVASPARDLAEAIQITAERIAGAAFLSDAHGASNPSFFHNGEPGAKPHGRLVWSFHLGGGPYIDLSVMPRKEREMSITLMAHTPPGTQPAYLNATLADDGMVEVTVRGPVKPDGNFGDTAMIRLERDTFKSLLLDAETRLDMGRPVPLR